MLNISALEKLVHELSRLPGVGHKTAQRLAYHILRRREDYVENLSQALHRVLAEVHTCPECFNFTDQTLCRYCSEPSRRNDILCVVEDPSDIMRVESSGAFNGRYHVLHGSISPLEGIHPDDLKIHELSERLKAHPEIQEVILALDADLEGDTTTLYLCRQFRELNLKITRLAHGIPIGGDIDFIDDRTMGRALQNRVEL